MWEKLKVHSKKCFGKGRTLLEVNIAILNYFFCVLRVSITKFYQIKQYFETFASWKLFRKASIIESEIDVTIQFSVVALFLSLISNSP